MGIYEPRNLCGQAKTSKGTGFETHHQQNFYFEFQGLGMLESKSSDSDSDAESETETRKKAESMLAEMAKFLDTMEKDENSKAEKEKSKKRKKEEKKENNEPSQFFWKLFYSGPKLDGP